MNSAILENSSVIVHGSHRWQETGKVGVLFNETHFKVEDIKESDPVTIEHHDVEYSHSHAPGYLKVRLGIIDMHSVNKS